MVRTTDGQARTTVRCNLQTGKSDVKEFFYSGSKSIKNGRSQSDIKCRMTLSRRKLS